MSTYLNLKTIPKNLARVLICYDALLQIRSRKLIPKAGVYFSLENKLKDEYGYPKRFNEEDQLDKLLEENKCEACALGTLFACRVRIQNRIKVGEMDSQSGDINTDEMGDRLKSYFDELQLALIEACFEGSVGGLYGCAHEESINTKVIEAFHKKYSTDASRLIAIMKNIIKNSGEFIPEQNTKRKAK